MFNGTTGEFYDQKYGWDRVDEIVDMDEMTLRRYHILLNPYG